MCLHDDELFLLIFFFGPQLAKLGLVFATSEGRASLRFDLRSCQSPLVRTLLFTIPAAALIKLFHDWIGLGHRTVCMSRPVFLVGCLLFCAAVEFGSSFAQQVETDSGLDLADRYPLRWWGLYGLIGAVWIALFSLIPFK